MGMRIWEGTGDGEKAWRRRDIPKPGGSLPPASGGLQYTGRHQCLWNGLVTRGEAQGDRAPENRWGAGGVE